MEYETGQDFGDDLRATVERQRRDLRLLQTELEQTNAGLLALHAEVERQRQRSDLLDEVSRTVSASLDGQAVIAALVTLLESTEVADSAAVWIYNGDDQPHRVPSGGEAPDPAVERVRVSREPVAGPRRLLVPLVMGPNLAGVLELCRAGADFAGDDLAFVTEVAARAAVGLRNASEYEREREVAERLQRMMLPALNAPPEVTLAARYRPATTGVNIGGDWFDGFTRPDGSVVLAVGDVTGHGLDAAVIMGKLQHALRAYATEGHGPATTLRLAHRLLGGWRSSLLASAVVVDLDLATGRMRWASAGHLPVLLTDPDGTVQMLERAKSPLLGVPFPIEPVEHEIRIEPGARLLLYTDGLVERRTELIDTGLATLAKVFGATRGLRPEAAGDRVLAEMLRGTEQEDDVCLLLCHWTA